MMWPQTHGPTFWSKYNETVTLRILLLTVVQLESRVRARKFSLNPHILVHVRLLAEASR